MPSLLAVFVLSSICLFSSFLSVPFLRPFQGFVEHGSKGIYFWGTREQRPEKRGTEEQGTEEQGTEEQRTFWGTGNIGNQDFDFGEQSNLYQGNNKGTGTPPQLRGPHS